MANIYYRYGRGKSAELCITAYNYREQSGQVAIYNADNDLPVKSNVKGKNYSLETNITDKLINQSIFEKGFTYKRKNICAILIDNAHMLSKKQVEEFFLLAKVFDIPVIAYGQRVNLEGAIRFMELANKMEPVDGLLTSNLKTSGINFYYGAMNSGKTTKLCCKTHYLESIGKKVCLIRSVFDRNATSVKSRSNISRSVDILADPNDSLKDLVNDKLKGNVDYFFVDEAQFLSIKQIDELIDIGKKYNALVSCYGLKTDFRSYVFPGSGYLLMKSDYLERLRTVCSCDDKTGANFNARVITDNNGAKHFTNSGEQVAIDGNAVTYTSLCDKCYLKKVLNIPIENPIKVLKLVEDNLVFNK